MSLFSESMPAGLVLRRSPVESEQNAIRRIPVESKPYVPKLKICGEKGDEIKKTKTSDLAMFFDTSTISSDSD